MLSHTHMRGPGKGLFDKWHTSLCQERRVGLWCMEGDNERGKSTVWQWDGTRLLTALLLWFLGNLQKHAPNIHASHIHTLNDNHINAQSNMQVHAYMRSNLHQIFCLGECVWGKEKVVPLFLFSFPLFSCALPFFTWLFLPFFFKPFAFPGWVIERKSSSRQKKKRRKGERSNCWLWAGEQRGGGRNDINHSPVWQQRY